MWPASFEPVESHVGQCQLVVHPGHYRHPRQQTRLGRFELRIAPGEHYGCLWIAPVEIAYGTAAFAVGLGGNAAGVHHNKIRNATLGAVCDSVCGKNISYGGCFGEVELAAECMEYRGSALCHL